MGWTDALTKQMEGAHLAAARLIGMAEGESLDWKPENDDNWMTLGQLIRHLDDSCGVMFKGFVSGEWDFAEGLPSVESIAEGKTRLEADRLLAIEALEGLTDNDLGSRMVKAPWGQTEQPLGLHLSQMVSHLDSHKCQLFYYLKLLGKPVNTATLWGMSDSES
ncbi:DinB family protein [Candidatus Bipolaricaulota bacterium]